LKNSTNSERGSISKAINKIAESVITGGASEASDMMTMLSNQMNQQSMQQQMFQQSLKMQMDELEKKGDMTNKYLRCIVQSISGGGCKRKKKRSKGSSSSSSSSSSRKNDGDGGDSHNNNSTSK
jgi:hypothetical protein